jgi:hypothetical protein
MSNIGNINNLNIYLGSNLIHPPVDDSFPPLPKDPPRDINKNITERNFSANNIIKSPGEKDLSSNEHSEEFLGRKKDRYYHEKYDRYQNPIKKESCNGNSYNKNYRNINRRSNTPERYDNDRGDRGIKKHFTNYNRNFEKKFDHRDKYEKRKYEESIRPVQNREKKAFLDKNEKISGRYSDEETRNNRHERLKFPQKSNNEYNSNENINSKKIERNDSMDSNGNQKFYIRKSI